MGEVGLLVGWRVGRIVGKADGLTSGRQHTVAGGGAQEFSAYGADSVAGGQVEVVQ